jgi:hypothetical protein
MFFKYLYTIKHVSQRSLISQIFLICFIHLKVTVCHDLGTPPSTISMWWLPVSRFNFCLFQKIRIIASIAVVPGFLKSYFIISITPKI